MSEAPSTDFQTLASQSTREHLVCLTFDFDTISYWIAKGQTNPVDLSRGEFGVVGAGRILELLAGLGIQGTWFIPGLTIDTYPEACAAVVDAGHEVGHHGYDHISPTELDREAEADQLDRGNECIMRLTGRPARGYRAPGWDLSPNSVALLVERGFVYDSSLMGRDYTPYQARYADRMETGEPVAFGADSPLLELPVSWSLDDFTHFEFREGNGLMNWRSVLDNWYEDFRYMKQTRDWGVITYTFHPFVIGRGHRMRALEDLIRKLSDEGALFITAGQALERWSRRLASPVR
ncbi:MAG: polysaccharide deacetylase [Arenicellales bacterium]